MIWNQIKTSLSIPYENKGLNKPLWNLKEDKQFTTISVKKAIFNDHPSNNSGFDDQLYKNLWKSAITKKCKFFIWSTIHEGINTKEIL